MRYLYTLGDSVLDCGVYNHLRVTPGDLLFKNCDDIFPEFNQKTVKLVYGNIPIQLKHMAIDGSIVEDLFFQCRDVPFKKDDVALISVGGNDFLRGLYRDPDGQEIEDFINQYGMILSRIPSVKLIFNIYDPFFGKIDQTQLFPPGTNFDLARKNYDNINHKIRFLANRYGILVDLHKHFLTGKETWFVKDIEPSLEGASEIRRVVWDLIEKHTLFRKS